MAGISTKAIKAKMKSMESTRQITKAMELVASSKLRGAQEHALSVRAYYNTLFDAMQEISASSSFFDSRFLKKKPQGRHLYIVIAGDRGLAGGYNNNIFRLAHSEMPEDAVVLPIGKRSLDHFRRNSWEIADDRFGLAAKVSVGECYTVAKLVAEDFAQGKYSGVSVIYTRFESMLSQKADIMRLMPLTFRDDKAKAKQDIIYEGGSESVFNALVPEYLGGVLYGCLGESLASEQAARRTAMNSASKNADEMIAALDLQFNRARQAAITQEITEIVAGSEA